MYRHRVHTQEAGFAVELGRFGPAPALIAPERTWTYAELETDVAKMAGSLGPTRRLIQWEAAPTPEALIAYLAALRGGHPVLVTAPGQGELIAQRYAPSVRLSASNSWRPTPDECDANSPHDLHPDLALLLSTSGSTGSPKLVRLSARNLTANAESIAQYLNLSGADRGITSLPLSYCYGLSVLHSHLLVGAAVVLTDKSVVDECFWASAQRHSVTGLAGVPHTFELLQRSGFADRDLPSLRYVTQAGGRMDPARVVEFAQLGQRRGYDLFVMYGQTEATARMAYLPPDLAVTNPDSVGVAIPGGSFEIAPVAGAEPGTGELLYRGDNVMLGYADGPADLARGRDLDVLRTGDLARIDADGLVRIVGRRSRFAKVLGLRISLDQVEGQLRRQGIDVACVDVDGRLGALGAASASELQSAVAAASGLPCSAVVAVTADVPRTERNKPDYAAVQEACRARAMRLPGCHGEVTSQRCGVGADVAGVGAAGLRDLYAELLDRPDATELDSFVSLGGDSLSYVEVSVALEERLGDLPAGWHLRSVRALAEGFDAKTSCREECAEGKIPSSRLVGSWIRRLVPTWRAMDTSVLLRAVAIVVIVGSHIGVFNVRGGAHVLIAVAGYNLARFHLTPQHRRARARSVLRTTARIAIPSMVWLAALVLIASEYPIVSAGLLNQWLGPADGPGWRYWFIEVLVVLLLGMALLAGSRRFDRWERTWPFALPVLVAAGGLFVRYGMDLDDGKGHYVVAGVAWLFAIGWAAAKASTFRQRALVTVLAALGAVGYFPSGWRDGLILAGVLALVWVPAVRVPTLVRRAAAPLAAASLYVYLTHYAVYPPVRELSPWLALAVSLAIGIGAWLAAERMQTAAGRCWTNRRPSLAALARDEDQLTPISQPRAFALSRSNSS